MMIILGLLVVGVAVLISVSDKIIEDLLPNGDLAQVSEETDEVMASLDE